MTFAGEELDTPPIATLVFSPMKTHSQNNPLHRWLLSVSGDVCAARDNSAAVLAKFPEV